MMFEVFAVVVTGMFSTGESVPTLTVDRKVTELYQYQQGTVKLFQYTCTPSPGCVVAMVTMQPSQPCALCFNIYPCPGVTAGEYCLNYLPGQGSFVPTVAPRYLITSQALEIATGDTVQVLVEVRITPNNPPYFDYNGDMFVNIQIASAKSKDAGYVIDTLKVKDDEGDALTFSMTTVPPIEGIELDQYTGVLRVTRHLKSVCYSGFTGVVRVSDGTNQAVGPFLVNVELQYANDPPIITNLNTEIFVREDEKIDNNIYTFFAVDSTTYDAITYTFTAVPPAGISLFEIKNNNLKLKSALDHEGELQTVTLTLQANDGYCSSPPYTLTVHVADVNEPPVILPSDQTVLTCEGWASVTPRWNVSDPDQGDRASLYQLQGGNSWAFAMDTATGTIRTTIDYDVDPGKRTSQTEVVTVVARDTQGLTATATLSIRLTDCNDNAPYFTRASKTIEVGDCTPVGTSVGTVPKADDDDSDTDDNNVVEYSGSGGGVQVQPQGNIILTSPLAAGETIEFPVYARDKGKNPGPLVSPTPVWITLYGTKCPTTPAPPTTSPDPRNTTTTTPTTTTTTPRPTTSRNVATFGGTTESWVIVAIVVGVVLGLLSLFMLVKYGVPAMRRSCMKGGQSGRRGRHHHHHHHHHHNPGNTYGQPPPGI